METRERLSATTLAALGTLPEGVSAPLVDARALSIGIVHFGIGAFHRAHQAVFTEDAAAASGDRHWGILGVTGRGDAVVRQLEPQDCLYGVLESGTSATSLRLVGSVREVAWPSRDSERVVEVIALPTTHLATLSITEKGYLRAPDGTVDVSLDVVRRDIELISRELDGEAGIPASGSPLGLLVRGLARRFRTGGAPFTVVPCDNIVGNGEATRLLVESFVAALGQSGSEFAAWLAASVTFPSTMVDRITPATTDEDRTRAAAMLGLRDDALVVAEPFKQWVIEDKFAGLRPAWELADAILTTDVAPYERIKIRVLNGAHSMFAYLGALKGHETIAETVGDPALRNAVVQVLNDDVLPTLEAPAGIDLTHYRDSVLERFANPGLAHTTAQVGMDGSQKLPFRFVSTAADRLATGHLPSGLALALAAWISYLATTSDPGGPSLDDPLARQLQAAVGSSAALALDPAGVVDRVFDIAEVFSREVSRSLPFRAAVVASFVQVRALTATSSPEGARG